jgi:hypothetical protein
MTAILKNYKIWAALCLATIFYLTYQYWPALPADLVPAPTVEAAKEPAQDLAKDNCAANLGQIRAAASERLLKHDPDKAFELLHACRNFLGDGVDKLLYVQALQQSNQKASDANDAAAKNAPSSWSYGTFDDPMTGKADKTATIKSSNTLELARTYTGTNSGHLLVRKTAAGKTSVILSIDKGQLICNSYSGCNVSVRFDEASAIVFGASPTSDYNSRFLFILSEAKFVAQAAKAKRILVQVLIYQAGNQVLEFDSSQPYDKSQ